jgi:hypothetical protein
MPQPDGIYNIETCAAAGGFNWFMLHTAQLMLV